eukprot:SAG31_NODE_35871_length_319_cov_0.604545_1_plen_58_part_01
MREPLASGRDGDHWYPATGGPAPPVAPARARARGLRTMHILKISTVLPVRCGIPYNMG